MAIVTELWPLIVAAVIGGLFYARRSGVKSEQNKTIRAEAKAREVARDVEIEVDSLDDDALRDRASKWLRKR